jgi:hypothetical protein
VENVNEKDPIGTATAFRIRRSEALIERIRRDHLELNRLWESFRKGVMDIHDINEVLELTSSVREALRDLDELKREDLEGVLWAGSDAIEKDVSDKETSLRISLYSVFKERDYCHLK